MKKQKTRDIVVDADHVLYLVTEAKSYKSGFSEAMPLRGNGKIDMTLYQEHFDAIIQDYITIAEVESICYKWTIGKIRVILSDHSNFRYDIFPEYKSGRPPTPKIRKKLKEWAMKKYHFEPNTEADDVVAYYVKKGAMGFTTDKDLFRGVKGLWYNCHHIHRCWVKTSKEQADFFFKQQVLGGDDTDGIPGIAGIALGKAEKLLLKYGNSWETILSIYKDKTKIPGKTGKEREVSYSKEYMITMVRLVCMSQWAPKRGIHLWEFPKK